MSFLSRARVAFLALAAALAFTPAQAQLDPRLQVVATDLIQVYQSTPANPELLTCYDFSGSMHAIYWNSTYYTDPGQSNHSAQWAPSAAAIHWNTGFYGAIPTSGDYPGLVPVVNSSGQVYMAYGSGNVNDYSNGIVTYTDSVSGKTRILWPQDIANPQNLDPTTGVVFSPGQLISPDGNVISVAGTVGTADIMKASHIRITASYLNGATKVSRTIDLPIPWMVMDTTKSGSSADAVSRLTIPDTIGGGPAIEPDIVSDPNNINKNNSAASGNLLNSSVTDTGGTAKKYQKIGRLHYNLDYLWWVFFGQDVRNGSDDGTVPTSPAGTYAISDITQTVNVNGTPVLAKVWNNGLTGFTRFQALKTATISAWLTNQKKVWWGARFLDTSEQQLNTVKADNGNASSPAVDRNINLFRPAANSSTANSAVLQFSLLEPTGGTPLTYAFANSYTQLAYTSDSGSSFGTSSGGGQSGTEKPIPPCRKSFLVVFTDGLANDQYGSTSGDAIGDYDPYAQDSAGHPTLTAGSGNTAVSGYGLSTINPSYASGHSGHGLFNLWTLAGIAAHYPPPYATTPSSGSSSYTVSSVVPFEITTRGATTSAPRAIRTMTVAMSVGGAYNNALGSTDLKSNSKKALYRAALYGNPESKSWDVSTKAYNPDDPNSDPAVNPFFFDATDVTRLSKAMTAILAEVTAASGSISAPASPLVGLSLGNQVYLGLFQTAQNTPRWQGDLLMSGLAITSDGTFFVDKDLNVVSSLTGLTAVWSAEDKIFEKREQTWLTRNLYTNFDTATNSTNTTKLIKFDENQLPLTTAPGVVGAPDTTTAQKYVRFMRGANPTGEADGTTDTPRGDIFGDIINSSPTVVEYPIDLIKNDSGKISTVLDTAYGKWVGNGKLGTPHFRLIFVGDNQGVFHAFGEVAWAVNKTITRTYQTGVDAAGNPIYSTKTYQASVVTQDTSAVDELWAFFPGEYLPYISYYRNKANPHRYGMDGTATVYINDTNNDGIVNNGETVRVIIGERKGGRSLYAFDFSDISNITGGGVKMAWNLLPDTISVANATQKNVLQRMGFSTSTPTVGRVDTGSGTIVTKDLLFVGGGLSTSALDTSLSATYGAGTKFGRSLIAFDVVNGPSSSLYTWNFADSTFTTKFGAMGCIPAAVVPTDLAPGRGRTWRVYFSDTPTDANASSTSPRGGGLWALGDTYLFQTSDGATAPNVIRRDTTNIDTWTSNSKVNTTAGIRHVFQANTGFSLTTTPGVFLLGTPSSLYPVARAATPKNAVQTVAITFGTGDRNDPTDQDSIDPNNGFGISGAQNYLNVVFDRNDSASLSGVTNVTGNIDTTGIGLYTGLADLSAVASLSDPQITLGNSQYYLKNYLGYRLKMGAATAQPTAGKYYYPKVITTAVVLNGVLFFSDFLPGQGGTGSCTGTGLTNTYRICDVMAPVFNNGTPIADSTFNSGSATCSGIILSFPNLPGEITALGTTSIIQTGQGTSTAGSGGGGTINNTGANVGSGPASPGSHVFSPRAWRVIR